MRRLVFQGYLKNNGKIDIAKQGRIIWIKYRLLDKIFAGPFLLYMKEWVEVSEKKLLTGKRPQSHSILTISWWNKISNDKGIVFQKSWYKNVIFLVYTAPSSMTHWNSKNRPLNNRRQLDNWSFTCWNYHQVQIVTTTIAVSSCYGEIFKSL